MVALLAFLCFCWPGWGLVTSGPRPGRSSACIRAQPGEAGRLEPRQCGIFHGQRLDQRSSFCHHRNRHSLAIVFITMPSQIGELLIKENFITGEQLETALKHQSSMAGAWVPS